MILKKLHVENFGKLTNLDLDLKQGLNELLKKNGWGKTTLSVFIKSMFYGLPAKTRGDDFKSERTRYMPWQGGVYGGYIEYQTDKGLFRVTRTFGKTPEGDTLEIFDYSSNKNLTAPNSSIGDVLFGLGEESFKLTAFFPQLGYKSSSNDELTASLTGVNKYTADLDSVDSAIKKLKEKRLDIKHTLPDKKKIEEKRQALGQAKVYVAKTENDIETIEKDIEELKNKLALYEKEVEVEKDKLSFSKEKFAARREKEEELNRLMVQSQELYAKKLDSANVPAPVQPQSNNKKLSIAVGIIALVAIVTLVLLGALKVLSLYFSLIPAAVILAGAVGFIIAKRPKKIQVVEQEVKDDYSDKLSSLTKEIEGLKEELEQLGDIIMPNEEDFNLAREKFNHAHIELVRAESNLSQFQSNLEESYERIDYLQTEIEKEKSALKDGNEKVELIEKTIDYLQEARDNVSKRFVTGINSQFSEILSQFNLPNQFVIDSGWKVKEILPIGSKEFEYSSQGIQDILSFCQRISLIEQVYKKEKPCLILDDTFVNLDDKMMDCAKELVRKLSETYQIVYICCHTRCSIE